MLNKKENFVFNCVLMLQIDPNQNDPINVILKEGKMLNTIMSDPPDSSLSTLCRQEEVIQT